MNHLNLAMIGETFDAVAELVENAVLPIAEFFEIDLRLAESDAASGRFFALAQDLSGMEQGFRRNAADVQANPAEARVLFYEGYFFTLVRSVKCCGVSAWPGAQYQNFRRHRFHSASIYCNLMSPSSN